MAILGGATAAFGIGPRAACAANTGNGTRVLFINLNGGLDGLYALQPQSGALYSALAGMRSSLLHSPETLLPAANNFGFHPHLTLFKNLFDADALSVVLSTGYKNMSRSHLDSEVVMARGVPDRLTAASSGFLNRLGAAYQWNSLNAMSVTGTDLAFEGGDFRGIQVESLEDFYFRGYASTQEREHLVASMLDLASSQPATSNKRKLTDFAEASQLAANYTEVIGQVVDDHVNTVSYPGNQFGRALRDIDRLFSSSAIETRVGYMRCEGFDTHSQQGTVLDGLLQQFNAALSAFVTSMQAKGLWSNLIIYVFSEFGRSNEENGSEGTDHGGANSVFLLGGAVRGGNIFGELLTSDLTDEEWLPMRVNIVEIYRRIVARMGLDPDLVFAANDGPSLGGLFT